MPNAFSAGRKQHQERTHCVLYQDYEEAAMPDRSYSAHGNPTLNGGIANSATAYYGDKGCAYDATDDYYTFANDADWAFGTEPFTIEASVRYTNLNTVPFICWGEGYWSQGSYMMWSLLYVSGVMRFSRWIVATEVKYDFSFTPTTGVYHHFLLSRDENQDLRLFVDGVQKGSTQACTTDYDQQASKLLESGHTRTGNNGVTHNYFDGYQDELRIYKGLCVESADFAPRATAFAI